MQSVGRLMIERPANYRLEFMVASCNQSMGWKGGNYTASYIEETLINNSAIPYTVSVKLFNNLVVTMVVIASDESTDEHAKNFALWF